MRVLDENAPDAEMCCRAWIPDHRGRPKAISSQRLDLHGLIIKYYPNSVEHEVEASRSVMIVSSCSN
eukprot:4844186-Amphidinium_carterae.1